MKIGIITFWTSNDNYGEVLQCYALQKFLRNLGHDVYLIRYDYVTDKKKNPLILRILKAINPIKLFKYLKNKKHIKDVKREQKIHDRDFSNFKKKYIVQSEKNYSSYTELRSNPPEADIYIVGSDQIWNNWFNSIKYSYNPIHVYFLDFGSKEIKRISYAASWGVKDIPVESIKTFAPLLKQFDFISVREEVGVDICAKCGRSDAEWVCDPTLLLSGKIYRDLYKENQIRTVKSKYLLLYILNNNFDFDIEVVFAFAKSKNLEVIYVTGNGVIDSWNKYYATIPEWLYLIDNAEYVITNSFHCAVFSTIFNKKFAVIQLSGEHNGMNTRFESLFKIRNIAPRYIINLDFSILDDDYKAGPVNVSQRFLDMLA